MHQLPMARLQSGSVRWPKLPPHFRPRCMCMSHKRLSLEEVRLVIKCLFCCTRLLFLSGAAAGSCVRSVESGRTVHEQMVLECRSHVTVCVHVLWMIGSALRSVLHTETSSLMAIP